MRLLPLAGFILISFIPSVGGLATEANKDWYRVLVKPWFTPPEWVFGTVWPVLFFILGFAAYRAWEVGGKARVTYVQLFLYNTALLTGWSWVFFALKSLWGGLALLLIINLVGWFKAQILRINGIPTWKWLILYQIWLVYALILNLSLIILN